MMGDQQDGNPASSVSTLPSTPPSAGARDRTPRRVVIQVRQRFLQAGLAAVLAREPDLDVVARVATADELLRCCGPWRTDVAVLEVDAPDWEPVEVITALLERHPDLHVVGLHERLDRGRAERVQEAGARVLVPYSGGSGAVVRAVRGESAHRPTAAGEGSGAGMASGGLLTPREAEVLDLVAEGRSTREISDLLGISSRTVENHKHRMFTKLGVQNQAHAVALRWRVLRQQAARGFA
jgi:DNA-binding NarL/FixJ family response regulator